MKRAVIGILAHVDAGKTTLSEALLYKCGFLRQLGRVDRQDSFLDNNELERERGITIFSKQAVFDSGGISFTLLDTPGHVDFSAEMERTLSVLDAAVLVVSGPDGIQAHTRTLWKLFRRYDIPTFIFVNKTDREGFDRRSVISALKKQFSDSCIDFSSEDASESSKDHDSFLESLALCDEKLMEQYLEIGSIDDGDIADLVGRRLLFPCFFGSALRLDGIDEFLAGLARYMPIGYDDPEQEPFGCRIYKIGHDSDGNRLSYARIYSGSVSVRDMLEQEKITGIRVYSGGSYSSVPRAEAGMVVAFTGLNGTRAGQTVGMEDDDPTPELTPVMTYRVVEKDRSRLLRLIPILRALEEEEPSLDAVWNEEVKELQIRIMGEVQLEIIKRLLHDRFNEDVEFDKGSILYKETIAAPVLGVGHFEPLRHYAEVQLLMEPGEPGSGITAESRVSVNDLEMNWQRLVMTHIFEREHRGALTGSELTDVKISLVAGRSHIKHTEGGDFRQATYRAIRQGLMKAESVLLEPYYSLELEIPRSCCGRAMTDIDKRHGRITSQAETGRQDMIILSGYAPVASMQGYVKELMAYTGGLGAMYTGFDGYKPCHNTEEVIAAKGYIAENDLGQPSSSVFCAHGAGFTVEWDQVDRYKHIDWDMKTGTVRDDSSSEAYLDRVLNTAPLSSESEKWVGTDEIDAILNRTFNANKKNEGYRNPYRKAREKLEAVRKPSSGSVRSHTLSGDLNKEKYLLVDGYNIIFGWQELSDLAKVNIDAARDRLNDILCNYQALHGGNLIVVYDAYRVSGHPTEYFRFHNIGMVFTREAETADRFIERFAHENSSRYDVTVATSDGVEQIIIRGAGCKLMTARDLEADVKRCSSELREGYIRENVRIGTELSEKLKDTGPIT